MILDGQDVVTFMLGAASLGLMAHVNKKGIFDNHEYLGFSGK
jgi:hypothetical protein